MSDPAARNEEGHVGVSAAPEPRPASDSTSAPASTSAPEASEAPDSTRVPDSTPVPDSSPVADSTPSPERIQLPDHVFELRSPPPVRALAIASAAAIAGAVVIVLSSHPAVTVVGALLLGFGVLLAVLAMVLAARLRGRVRVGEAGLEVSRGGRRGHLAWSDIDRVQESRHQLIVVARNDQRDLVITVPGPRGGTYVRLVQALKLRLDASRGYGS